MGGDLDLLLTLGFEGAPYSAGGLDRAALLEIANLQTLIVSMAAADWRQQSGDQTLPEDFVEAAMLRVVRFDPATVRVDLTLDSKDAGVAEAVRTAAGRLHDCLVAADDGERYAESYEHADATRTAAIGRVVSSELGEPVVMVLGMPGRGAARITWASRIAIHAEMKRRLDQDRKERIAERDPDAPRTIFDIFDDIHEQNPIPIEETLDEAVDGSSQVDHYAYGTPKRPEWV